MAVVATNRRSRDAAAARQRLSRDVELVELDLGSELFGRSGAARARGAMRSALSIPIAAVRLATLIRSRRIGLLHVTDRPRDRLMAGLLTRLTGVPHVLHLHLRPDCPSALQRADGLIAVSRFVAQSAVAMGACSERVHVLHNAADTVRFDPSVVKRGRLRSELGLASGTPLLGVVGRMMHWKGQHLFLDALALARQSVPNAVAVVIGREDSLGGTGAGYAAELRRRAEALGLAGCVHWCGWRDDIPEAMADLDVLCVPSAEEPFGLVVIEAMSMSRPVAAFGAGGIPDIITDGVDGLLVAPGDAAALAAAVTGLVRDPVRARDLGDAGRRTVLERFTPERHAASAMDIYRRVVSEAERTGTERS